MKLTGNCKVICYADDETVRCPICDTLLIHDGKGVFCFICGYVRGGSSGGIVHWITRMGGIMKRRIMNDVY